MSYKYLEHTADVKFIAIGKTLEEAFTDSAKATTGVMFENVKKIQKNTKIKVEISAKKIESLLYDFISEMIYILDTKGILICDLNDLKIEKKDNLYFLKGYFLGDNYKNYKTNSLVKSMTYNDMEIKKLENNSFSIQVVLDI